MPFFFVQVGKWGRAWYFVCSAVSQDQDISHEAKDKRTERSQSWAKSKPKDDQDDQERTVSFRGSPCKVEYDPLMGMLSKMVLCAPCVVAKF